MHRKVEVDLQYDRREESNAFEGGDEGERPNPVSVFFTTEEDVVHDAVDDVLCDEVGNDDAEEDADNLVGGVEHEGASYIVGDIKEIDDGQQQAGLEAEKELEPVARIRVVGVAGTGDVEEVPQLAKDVLAGVGKRH